MNILATVLTFFKRSPRQRTSEVLPQISCRQEKPEIRQKLESLAAKAQRKVGA